MTASSGAGPPSDAVAVAEAVALVASLSTDESAGFVNGLLGRLMQLKPSLAD